jgi:mono/diheme cytochrome c family protein
MAKTRESAENASPKRERGKEPSSLGPFEVALFHHARVRYFDATALCRGALRWLLRTAVPFCVLDATALCRGRSRWLLTLPGRKEREVPRHKAVASGDQNASGLETNVTNHGTRPWHCLKRNQAPLLRCIAVALLATLPIACQQDMAAQPSYKPLDPSDFFVDGRSARPLVPGTVARGHLRLDTQLYTGKRTRESRDYAGSAAMIAASAQGPLGVAATIQLENRDYVDTFPFPVTRDVLEQGRNRYMIYCVVCHDPLGTGHGKIVERGYTQPPSYHIPRLREAPVGRFFDVMTNGYGSMPSYREQIPPRDRWAIVAYIRALQRSQHASRVDLPPAEMANLDKEAQ